MTSSMLDRTDPPARDPMTYIETLFDVHRSGLAEIADQIISYLDYHSMVQFKRSSRFVYQYISNSNLEEHKLRAKLNRDWMKGQPRQRHQSETQGLVGCAKIIDNGTRVLCGVDHHLRIYNIRTNEVEVDFHDRESGSPIGCVDVYENLVFSGAQDGILGVWDKETGDLLNFKQLFGKIECLRCKNGILVTAHFGDAYDMGCISVRRIESATELPVITALVDGLFPIVCMDFTDRLIATIEWSGTFDNVHSGNTNIYDLESKVLLANLSAIEQCTFTCCRFFDSGEHLITGGHDAKIRIWHLTSEAIECVKILRGHGNIITRLDITDDHAITKDLDSTIIIWDIRKAMEEENKDVTPSECWRKVENMKSRTVTCIAVDERQLFMGSIGHFDIFDYWDTT